MLEFLINKKLAFIILLKITNASEKKYLQFISNIFTIIITMPKVKTFLHVFINSLFPYGVYYKKILHTRWPFSLKYFATFLVALHIIFALVLFLITVTFNQNVAKLSANLVDMLNSYPSDLVITIKQGRLMTNYDRPYLLWFHDDNVPTPVLAVDEFAAPQQILRYQALVLLHGQGLTIYNPQKNMITTYPFSPYANYTITKQRLTLLYKFIFDRLSLRWPLLILIYTALQVVAAVVFLLATLLYFGLLSLIALPIARYILKMHHVHYKKIWQISLHTSTLPLIFAYMVVLSRLQLATVNISNVFTQLTVLFLPLSIVYAAFLTAGLYEAYSSPHR